MNGSSFRNDLAPTTLLDVARSYSNSPSRPQQPSLKRSGGPTYYSNYGQDGGSPFNNYQADPYGGPSANKRPFIDHQPQSQYQVGSQPTPWGTQTQSPLRGTMGMGPSGGNVRGYGGLQGSPQQPQVNYGATSNYYNRPGGEYPSNQYSEPAAGGPYNNTPAGRPQLLNYEPGPGPQPFGSYDSYAGPGGARYYDNYGSSGGPPPIPYYSQPLPPRTGRLDTDTFSPFYGIEELPFDDTEEAEAEQDFTVDADINTLTRDAQIIAGIKPEENDAEISEETVQKAQEIEVTVPSELMLPDSCQLCQATFTNPQMAQSHYVGKKHAQKENQYIRKIYEEKGINVTRFLQKPKDKTVMLMTGSRKKEDKKEAPKPKKYRFACRLCDLYFENKTQIEVHITVVTHRKKVFDDQTAIFNRRHGVSSLRSNRFNTPYYSGAGSSKKYSSDTNTSSTTNNEVGDFFCSVCNKVLNSRVQYDAHMESKKHLAKLDQYGE